jgi:diguanylate cyclase (GGDEF)-like protein/PAS domain S-box-containing protein
MRRGVGASYGVRQRILLHLAAAMLAVGAAIFVAAYRYKEQGLERDTAQALGLAEAFLAERSATDATMMEAILRSVAANREVAAAFMAGDRRRLMELVGPTFARMRSGSHITHLYFIDRERRAVLRVHQPDLHGDAIARQTLDAAARGDAAASSIELGPMGSLALRLVIPWQVDGALIGYLEVAKDVAHIVADLQRFMAADLYILLHKDQLERDQWEARQRAEGRTPAWDRFSNLVVDQALSPRPPDQLVAALEEGIYRHGIAAGRVEWQGRLVQPILLPIVAGEADFGDVLIALDLSDRHTAFVHDIALIALVCVLAGGALLAFFSVVLGRVEARIARTEHDLRASEASLANAQRIARLGNWDWDIIGGTLRWSDEIYRIFGTDPRTFSATYQAFLGLVHPDDRAFVERSVAEALRGAPYAIDHRIVLADGTVRTVHEQGEVNFDAAGRPVRMAGVVQDVTEKRQRQETLRKLSEAVEQSPAAVVIVDRDGTVEYVNRRYVETSGYATDEVIGRPLPSLAGEGAPAEQAKIMWEALTAGRSWDGEVFCRRKGGEGLWEHATATPIRRDDGTVTHFLISKEDITLRKAYEQRLLRQANYDELTGLPNRILALDRLNQALARLPRERRLLALLFVGIDNFKSINDTFGHQIGDRLLRDASARIRGCVREEDTVARFGGDQFLVLLGGIDGTVDAEIVARKVIDLFVRPFHLDGNEVFVSASVGISVAPIDSNDPHILMANADAALNLAKEEGRATSRFFTADLNRRARRRLSLETHLRRALAHDEMELHFQPVVAAADGRLAGVEALLRWRNPELGAVPPDAFIPVAEETGLIVPIGDWVLTAACRQVGAWRAAGLAVPRVAVNISGRQFTGGHLAQVAARVLVDSRLPPDALELEITESLLVRDSPEIASTIQALDGMGVMLSVDDFGTGYSSLGYLKRFPVDRLKIDRSFIRDVTADPADAALVEAIVAMAHKLGMEVTGEGVETAEQLDFLRRSGCDLVQGFLLCHPLPAAELTPRLAPAGGAGLAVMPVTVP